MTMMSGAQMLVRTLEDLGVEYLFGYPGGAVLDIYDALHDSKKIHHVLGRHEQAVAHAADGRIHGYLQFHDHRPPDRHRTDRRCHRQVLLRLRRGRHAGARRGLHAAGRRVGLPGQRTQGPMTYNP